MKGITFNPQIDSKSTEIVAKKGRIPLPKREVKSKKYELDNNSTFHPNLKNGLCKLFIILFLLFLFFID